MLRERLADRRWDVNTGLSASSAPMNDKDNGLVPHDHTQKPLSPFQQATMDRVQALEL